MKQPQVTENQHYVPKFYLRMWSLPGKNIVWRHDLKDGSARKYSPKSILKDSFFYEEDKDAPDNRVENLLGRMENECAPDFKKLHELTMSGEKDEKTMLEQIKNALSDDTCAAIKTFAAYQYVRVPGAIERKSYELETTNLMSEQKDYLLNAGRFVETGFSYVHGKIQSLKLLVMLSTTRDFVTSDWPFFDFKDFDFAPLLGEEIGVNPDVIAYVPLNPRLGGILYPFDHFPRIGNRIPSVHIISCRDSMVRNQNALVIQQAVRYVIARERSDFIFRVARNHRKVHHP